MSAFTYFLMTRSIVHNQQSSSFLRPKNISVHLAILFDFCDFEQFGSIEKVNSTCEMKSAAAGFTQKCRVHNKSSSPQQTRVTLNLHVCLSVYNRDHSLTLLTKFCPLLTPTYHLLILVRKSFYSYKGTSAYLLTFSVTNLPSYLVLSTQLKNDPIPSLHVPSHE